MAQNSSEITSLISVPITICNVPDPYEVQGQFVYNFYLENEDKDYTPLPTSPVDYSLGLIDKQTVDSIEQRERGSLKTRVPRYIKIRISTNTLGIDPIAPGELTTDVINRLKNTKIGNSSYSLEASIENDYNAKRLIGDASIKTRLQKSIYRIAASMLNEGSLFSEKSDFQISDQLNKLLSDEIDAASIVDSLSDNEIKGIRFSNEVSGKRFNRLDNKSSLQYPTKINAGGYRNFTTLQVKSNPFSGDFLADTLGDFADDSRKNPLFDPSLFRSLNDFNVESMESLQPSLIPIDPPNINAAETTQGSRESIGQGYPEIKHLGYVVEKMGQSPDNVLESFDDFVSLNPDISEFIDPNVKYGYTYFYKARQLYRVRFPQIMNVSDDGETIDYVIVTAVIASSSPKPVAVQAVETDPPNAPGTLICSFIYNERNGIRLDWARPPNPTLDIKKYQVFRRRSIIDPFEIIAEYDFTDEGYTQFDQRESIDDNIVYRVKYPQYSHVDRDFTRESTYIYAVAAVDAHGLTSNYGTQIEAKFNRSTNKLQTRVVSRAGAPKAYPNYFVDPTTLEEFGSDRLIEDVIKDSSHGTMRIYFNPDAYKISSDEDGSFSEPIILSSARGSYKLQIVNLDRQVSRNLTIGIEPSQSLADLM